MPYLGVEPEIRVFYEDRGSGKPILFVHGWGGSGEVWDYQVLDLAPHFRCLTLDLRGHGASDKPWGDYTYDLFCRDIRQLTNQLGLRDVTLVGWSMGGGIGLRYVQEYVDNVSRLVMVDSGPHFVQKPDAPYGAPPEDVPALLDAIRLARPETIAGLYERNFHRTGLEPTMNWFISIGLRVPAFVGLTSFQSLLAEDLRPKLGELRIPTAVFHGRHDQIWDPRWAEYTAGHVPGAHLVWFENSGHVPFVEDRERFNRELADFVEGSVATAVSA